MLLVHQYGLDTSEFTHNPSESNRYQQAALQPSEERSRCTIMWSSFLFRVNCNCACLWKLIWLISVRSLDLQTVCSTESLCTQFTESLCTKFKGKKKRKKKEGKIMIWVPALSCSSFLWFWDLNDIFLFGRLHVFLWTIFFLPYGYCEASGIERRILQCFTCSNNAQFSFNW